MMKVIAKLLIISLLVSCDNDIVKGSNIIGNWENILSENMGGYQINAKTNLTIYKTDNGDFRYSYKVYVSDELYGSDIKLMENGTGILSKEVREKKWNFGSGLLHDRGSYIYVPKDNWEGYYPEQIEIGFGYQRGSNKIFYRR